MRIQFSPILISILIILSAIAVCFSFSDTVDGFIVNPAPKVKVSAPTTLKVQEDSNYYLDLYSIFEGSNDTISFTLWSGSSWQTSYSNYLASCYIKTNDTLYIEPIKDMFGFHIITINATNNGGSTEHDLKLTVTPTNDPPVIQMVGDIKVTAGKPVSVFVYQDSYYNVSVIAMDIDGDKIVYLDNSTLFDINYKTGNISFKPANSDVGTWYINITVSDVNGSNSEDSVELILTVLNVNDPPKATITSPINGSVFYEWDYVLFEAEGTDPDLAHGDSLEYEWYSDQDGYLGMGEEFESYYLSRGAHKITLEIKDQNGLAAETSIYITIRSGDRNYYYSLSLEMENQTFIINQNDQLTKQLMVSNWGKIEDNVTFDVYNHFNFAGYIDLEFENITLAPQETRYMNITITVPKDCKIGLYFIELLPNSSLSSNYGKEDYSYVYDKYENMLDLMVFVVENDTKKEKLNIEQPNWAIGDKWKYEFDNNEYSSSMPMANGFITLEVIADEAVKINNKDYQAYLLEIDSEIEISDDSEMSMFQSYNMTMTGKGYYNKADLSTISTEMSFDMTIDMMGEDWSVKSSTKSLYKPCCDFYDFPIKAAETWVIETVVDVKSETEYNGEMTDSFENTETYDMTASYICLGSETITTTAGKFETLVIASFNKEIDHDYSYEEDYYEDGIKKDEKGSGYGPNGGDGTRQMFPESQDEDSYTIEYFSPVAGNVVRNVNYNKRYDYDLYKNDVQNSTWDQTMIMELTSYTYKNIKDDSDDDELPDAWEDEYNVTEPSADDDMDTFTNLEEYLSGTNPIDKEDTPANPIDNDSDGLPDTWEKEHGLDPKDPNDALNDPDEDGFTTKDEFKAHTLPFDPNDHPEVLDSPSPNEKGKDDSFMGLGKVYEVDLAFLYMIVILIIIVILVLVAVVRIKSKRRKHSSQKTTTTAMETAQTQRVPEKDGAVTTVDTQYPATTDGRYQYDDLKSDLAYDPRPKTQPNSVQYGNLNGYGYGHGHGYDHGYGPKHGQVGDYAPYPAEDQNKKQYQSQYQNQQQNYQNDYIRNRRRNQGGYY